MKGALIAALSAAVLTACQPTTTTVARNTDLAPLRAEMEQFTLQAATASFLAGNCPQVSLRGGSVNRLLSAFSDRQTARGYTEADLNAATRSLDRDAILSSSIAYLEGTGLRPGQGTAEVCRSARTEVANATAVGQLLVAR